MDAATLTMVEIVRRVGEALARGDHVVTLDVSDPDLGGRHHAGHRLSVRGEVLVHRPWATWVDLGRRLHLRMRTPERRSPLRLRLRFERLRETPEVVTDPREKYGTATRFAQVHKGDDPSFVLDLADALDRATLPLRPRVLFLGVHRGDEVGLVAELLGHPIEAVGIDHCPSALAEARRRFPDARLLEASLETLPEHDIGTFDLVVAIDVLHSPRIDDGAVLHHIVQHRLRDPAAVLLGVPNGHYLDGELLPGARTRNFTQPELSLLVKRVAFYRRYLQQHRFRVFVTGQHEVLVTGTRPS